MALLSSSSSLHFFNNSIETTTTNTKSRLLNSFSFINSIKLRTTGDQSPLFHISTTTPLRSINICKVCTHDETLTLEKSDLDVKESVSEGELWAAAYLRVRTFFVSHQQDPHGVDDHLRYLAEREFQALKDRVAGRRMGFNRVSCINATVPLSRVSNFFSDDLSSVSKYSDNGEPRIVIGTLDLNQCLRLPDEITGTRPEGVGPNLARAYLSNVCVAKELHKNGIASSIVAKSKKVAQEWGITDLYVHVAVDNEPARKLYLKTGFTYESDEPAWQVRFLDRPRRTLLWTDLSGNSNL